LKNEVSKMIGWMPFSSEELAGPLKVPPWSLDNLWMGHPLRKVRVRGTRLAKMMASLCIRCVVLAAAINMKFATCMNGMFFRKEIDVIGFKDTRQALRVVFLANG